MADIERFVPFFVVVKILIEIGLMGKNLIAM